jgi:hypothetical protein
MLYCLSGGNKPTLPLIEFASDQSAAYNGHPSIVRMQHRRPLMANICLRFFLFIRMCHCISPVRPRRLALSQTHFSDGPASNHTPPQGNLKGLFPLGKRSCGKGEQPHSSPGQPQGSRRIPASPHHLPCPYNDYEPLAGPPCGHMAARTTHLALLWYS